ncbi:MAG: hypothetical protein Tsb0014_26330 [Pleurocapsa sp.]
MLNKLFGSNKKDNGFYLELNENKGNGAVKNAVETVTETVEAAKEKVEEIKDSEVVQSAVETVTETVETVKEKVEAVTTTEEAQAPAAPVAKKNGKKAQKSTGKSSKTTKSKAEQPKPAAPKTAPVAPYEPPFWVKAMYKNSSSNGTDGGSDTTFATDYLMPTISKYRRRPGPSLDKFKDMASKARTPRS